MTMSFRNNPEKLFSCPPIPYLFLSAAVILSGFGRSPLPMILVLDPADGTWRDPEMGLPPGVFEEMHSGMLTDSLYMV
jgi:hypothetical protein